MNEATDKEGRPLVQGSPDWWLARRGIPTASDFSRIVQPQEGPVQVPIDHVDTVLDHGSYSGLTLSTRQLQELDADASKATKSRKYARYTGLKLSASQKEFAFEILEERLTHPKDYLARLQDTFAGSPWIERGKQLEDEARAWLASELNENVRTVGFLYGEGRRYGASPDGITESGVAVELKVPRIKTWFAYADGGFPHEYMPQVHGEMLVTGAEQCILAVYTDHPELDCLCYRVKRSHFTQNLHEALVLFCDKVAALYDKHVH